jgi:hypothetical protein
MNRHGEDAPVDFTINLVPVSDITWRVSVGRPDAAPVTMGYLELQQGQVRVLWDAGDDQTTVLYESAEAAAAGVARRLLEVMPYGIRP